ncbi:TPA: sodium:solute symporter family protein [Clostridioides difficile]
MLLLIITCAIYIWIGFYFSKKVKTASDFLIAGRNLPLPILAATIAATSFGGGCLVGGVQWGAERGLWVGMYSTIGAALACFVNAFFAGKLRSLSCDITPADYIETRYGHSVFLRVYQSIVTPISILAIMGSQLISFGSVSTAFGIPYDMAVIIGVIVIIIYTYTSGMWGVAVSAFIQLAICIVFLPIVAYISLKLVGDNPLLMLQSMVKEPFFPGNKSINDFMYTVLPLVLGSIFSYESFLRYQCADNAKNAVKSSVIAGFILLFLAFPIGIIGAIGGSLFPNISSVQVLPQMISTTLPPLISVLFLAAILAAIMSTADSLMTSMSAIISRDIYNKLLHPNIEFNDLKNTLKYSQIASALTAVAGAIIALKFDSLLELLFWPAPLCTGVIFAPFVIGLSWKGATKKGAIYAVIVSMILALLNMVGILTVFDRILIPIIGGSITIFIVSKFSKKD